MTADELDTGAPADQEVWHLRLYVAGENPKSRQAIANLEELCKEHLAGRYDIEVIDLALHPSLAKSEDIIALPTLIRRLPEPLRRIIGDLSDTESVLVGLNVKS